VSDTVSIKFIDEVWIQVEASPGILQELSELLTFEVAGYKFMNAYRKRHWDGKIRLLKPAGKTYKGLIPFIKNFCLDNSYQFTTPSDHSFDSEYVSKFLSTLNISDSQGISLSLRDYQTAAVQSCITSNRKTILSVTGSGKSAIIYAMARFYLEECENKILIIVPNVSLVNQLYSDFKEYSQLNGWDVDKFVCKIYSGQERQDKRIILSTWQSQLNLDKGSFTNYDAVIMDEVHGAKGKEVSSIFERLVNTKYRFGFTGTLNNELCDHRIIQGLFGEVDKVNTTSELIKNKTLNEFKINCLILDYSEQERKKASTFKWEDEVQFLISNPVRNKIIAKLACSLKGNTLVLFSRVETHGELIYKEILNMGYKNVHFIYGGTEAVVREQIRKFVETETNSIIVASSQIFSQGINIKSLQNIIFSHPSKSRIRVLQSIGRILRVMVGKETSVLYDIVDDLRYKGRNNYSFKHFQERIKLYIQEEFPYKNTVIKLYKSIH